VNLVKKVVFSAKRPSDSVTGLHLQNQSRTSY
jgi:hypothetical protein